MSRHKIQISFSDDKVWDKIQHLTRMYGCERPSQLIRIMLANEMTKTAFTTTYKQVESLQRREDRSNEDQVKHDEDLKPKIALCEQIEGAEIEEDNDGNKTCVYTSWHFEKPTEQRIPMELMNEADVTNQYIPSKTVVENAIADNTQKPSNVGPVGEPVETEVGEKPELTDEELYGE